jgi:expansin (peptidoglycan-binding protein)
MIVAVSKLLFDTFPGYKGVNPNNNPICGKKIRANYQGKSAVLTITDRCEACAFNDLDFTPTAFQSLIGDLGIGRASGVEWDYI